MAASMATDASSKATTVGFLQVGAEQIYAVVAQLVPNAHSVHVALAPFGGQC
jgi:hypothetical protein